MTGGTDGGVTDSEQDDHRGRVAVEKHPAAIRWMHWLNFPFLVIMVWSGLRIYWANDVYAFGILDWELFHFFPDWFYERLDLQQRLARGIAFHFTFGWLFVLNGLAYVGYLALSGQWRHLVPDRGGLGNLVATVLHDLGLRKEVPPHGRYNAAQQVAYTAVIGLGIVIVASGFAIYKPTTLNLLTRAFGGYGNARLVHFISTIAFMAFFVLHVLQVARAGWRNLWSMISGYELVDAPTGMGLGTAGGEPDTVDPSDQEEVRA